VQQALQPASCIFKGATLRAVHVSVSTGSSPATASSPKHRQDRRRPSLGLGRASRWRAVGAGGLEARVGGSASGWACASREGCKAPAGALGRGKKRRRPCGGKARPRGATIGGSVARCSTGVETDCSVALDLEVKHSKYQARVVLGMARKPDL
jgi:hypothetical protein